MEEQVEIKDKQNKSSVVLDNIKCSTPVLVPGTVLFAYFFHNYLLYLLFTLILYDTCMVECCARVDTRALVQCVFFVLVVAKIYKIDDSVSRSNDICHISLLAKPHRW